MKYIIPENKLDKIVFKYLDLNLKGLEKRKAEQFDGILFAYPDEYYGMLGYENDGTLHIHYELINQIFEVFGLNYTITTSIIGKWFSDRFQSDVIESKFELYLS